MSEKNALQVVPRVSEEEPVPFINLAAQDESMAQELLEAVQRVLESHAFILGDEVSAFEAKIANYCDSQHAIGCASGSDALLLALMALDIGPGDEVITTPFSFFATVSSICRTGATPVFVDIDPCTFNMDTNAVEAAITDRTRAILPVHLFGQCVEMETLWRLAVRNGLSIIEDACQAIGAEYGGRRAGVLGTIGCFSFFPTKNLGGAGDGGIVTTDDPDLAARLRRLRVHGDAGQYCHTEIGINSRLDALQAALLSVKLDHLDQWTRARQTNAGQYDALFRRQGLLDAIEVPLTQPDRRHVFNQYCIRVKGGRRDEVLQSLRNQQIGCNVYYPIPLHLQECFASLGYGEGDLPKAEAAARSVLALPIFPGLGAGQQEQVVRAIAKTLGQSDADAIPGGTRAQDAGDEPRMRAA